MAGITMVRLGVLLEKKSSHLERSCAHGNCEAAQTHDNVAMYLEHIMQLHDDFPLLFLQLEISQAICSFGTQQIEQFAISNGEIKHRKGGIPLCFDIPWHKQLGHLQLLHE
jgi:hypothetical protein